MRIPGFHHFPELEELTKLHNVIVSSHVAFYTDENLRQITEKTLSNFEGFAGKTDLDEKHFRSLMNHRRDNIRRCFVRNCPCDSLLIHCDW